MTQKQKNLVGGISILGIAGLICKVVGVMYRIPLASGIGAQGIGIYQQVYPSYNLMLTIASAGIPVAISRMVAGYIAQRDVRNARRVVRISFLMLTALGAVMTLIMALLARRFADAVGTPEAYLSFLSIAPSLFLVCAMSAFRGEMQGRRRMTPTAISQLIEQVGKVFIALPLANYMFSQGRNIVDASARGAAGALLGTSMAEGVALLFMTATHFLTGKELDTVTQDETRSPVPFRSLARQIISVAIPISIGACIVPLANTVDSYMLKNLMSRWMTGEEALIRYGIYSGLVLPLINVPTAIAMAMSINLVPSVSAGMALDDMNHVRRESATGLRLASVIGFPCSVGMSLLAEPILSVLYLGGGRYTPEQIHLGGELLTFSALTIVLFTQVQATSGILQGIRKHRIPMYTLVAGVACKITLNYILVNIPSVNIHGAPFASLLCYTVSMVPNLYYVSKYTGLRLSFKDLVARPALSTGAMALAVLALKWFFGPDRLNHSILFLFLVIAAAIAVYGAAALLTGAVKKEDLPRRLRRFAR